MEIIITLVIAFIILAILYGILSAVLKKFPILIWIIGIGGGLIIGISTSWWIGLIAGFFMVGFLAKAESFGGHKCSHCGSYDTDVIEKQGSFELWKCNKCENFTYHN